MMSSPTRAGLRIAAIIALAVVASVGASSAFAFKPFGHIAITTVALENVTAQDANGNPVSFAGSAVNQVVIENVLQDTNQVSSYVHFDDEDFGGSITHIQSLQAEIIQVLQADPASNSGLARKYLGEALHTLQDFYSHSTWVDLFGPSPAATDFSDVLLAPSGTVVCSGGLLPNGALTSGYFDVTATIFGGLLGQAAVDGLEKLVIQHKCLHGQTTMVTPSFLPGINKDDPSHALYDSAEIAAYQHSLAFVQNIVDLLTAAGDFDAVCGLLVSKTCPQAPAITFTADNANIQVGEPVTLMWGTEGASTCTASGGGAADGWSGVEPLSGITLVTENAPGEYQYALTCVAVDGVTQSQAFVTVAVVSPLTISPATPTVNVGATVTLSVTDASGNPVAVTWQSSDTTLATISPSPPDTAPAGVVTGVSAGAPTITVTDPVSNATASVVVTVGGNPWVGTWDGSIISSCGLYSGPITLVITSGGGFVLDWTTYVGGAAAGSGSGPYSPGPPPTWNFGGGGSCTLAGDTMACSYPPACQTSTYTKE